MQGNQTSSNFRKLLAETIGCRKYQSITAHLPYRYYLACEFIYTLILRNRVSFRIYADVLVSFGMVFFYDIIRFKKFDSFLEIMKLQRVIKQSMDVFIEQKDRCCPFVLSEDLPLILKGASERKLSGKKLEEFITFLQKAIYGTKKLNIAVTKELIQNTFKAWDKDNANNTSSRQG